MTLARLKSRSRSLLASKAQTIAIAHPYALATAVTVAVLAISALVNRHLAKTAEHDNPPTGQFLNVDGVRLHYVERGSGAPLVLLHGNGTSIQISNQRFDRYGRQDLSRHRFRSSWLRR